MWLRRCRQRLKKQKSGNDAAWRVFLVYNGNGYKKAGLKPAFLLHRVHCAYASTPVSLRMKSRAKPMR